MWIAKPLHALSGAERATWVTVQGPDTPLSQTLAWGDAITAVGGRAFLVFNPEERVGGLVHSMSAGHGGDEFECVNGPLLHWDDGSSVARQFATFVMAVTRLSSRFSSVRLQPRWTSEKLDSRLGLLPIAPKEISYASTLHVPVKHAEEDQLAVVSPRLRRSLATARRSLTSVRKLELEPNRISEFAAGMKKFGEERGFFVPDEQWLKHLVRGNPDRPRESLRFWITEAQTPEAKTRLLTCVHGKTAHYLFGYDERTGAARVSLSTAAAAHFEVLKTCAGMDVGVYDLNGYTNPSDESHPYAGVSRFKAQFRGVPFHYASPLFWVEA